MSYGPSQHFRYTGEASPNACAGAEVIDMGMFAHLNGSDQTSGEAGRGQVEGNLAHAARLSLLGEMVSSIAHEVKQPLSAILLDGETGLRWLSRDEPDIAKLQQLLRRMVDGARRANNIVDRIREMSLRQAPRTAPVALNDIALEAGELLRGECGSRAVRMLFDLDSDLPDVTGDDVQLQQVVVNLLINAMQAIEDSGQARRDIVLRTERDGKFVRLSVHDTGPGITPDHASRIFLQFFSTKKDGMGMGLAICKRIVEAHSGKIQALNHEGYGASFVVTLPAAHPMADAP